MLSRIVDLLRRLKYTIIPGIRLAAAKNQAGQAKYQPDLP